MSSLDCLDLCRLCLVKDSVSVPIFGGEGDARQIFLKIAACLPVKVARDDKLPKKICDQCVCKIELCYEFWNTTVNSEKQLIEWLGGSGVEDKQNYVSDVLNPNIMKQEQSNENRLDGTVMQVSGHQSNMAIGMMGNLALNMPIIISTSSQQQISSVPMDTSCNSVQAAQPLPGPSSQTSHSQNQVNSVGQEEEESTEEDDNTDDDGDAEEGLPVKEESEEDVNTNRSIEPTTFVNVSLACDEAGPSGLQQQKISEMPEMTISQTTDGDPKSGFNSTDPLAPIFLSLKLGEDYFLIPQAQSTFLLKDSDTKATDRHLPKIKNNENQSVRKEEIDVDKVLNKIRNICPFCERNFDTTRKMERHVKFTHRKPYKCDKCKWSCLSARALDDHKLIHNPDYFFECKICHIRYKSESTLKRHHIRIHSDQESKYVCEHCGKSYKLKYDLNYHIKKTHALDLQICRFCGKEVKDLKYHEWRHQKRSREAKYEFSCHLCTKKFHHRSRLDNHLKLHEKGFKCDECGKECTSSNQLHSHKRNNHDKKLSTCIVCRKLFHSSSNFYQHVLTHAGIRPYKCDICEEDFTQRSSLLRHRRQHPGSLPPLLSAHPQIAELAKSYLEKWQSDQIDKSLVLNAKT